MTKLITIGNRGPEIAETNYWDSAAAQKGFYYLSWNAGAARLLVPSQLEPSVAEMKTAHTVIISRGPWSEKNNRDALELLFEDDSDSPYCIHLVMDQTDRALPETDQGGGFVVTVWTQSGKQLTLPGKYRTVSEIPCLQEWIEQ